MEPYEPIAIVQKVARGENHFDVTEFHRAISELDSNEFDQFCNRILHLTEFHDNNVREGCQDDPANIKDPVAAWDLKGIEIDNSHEDPVSGNNPVL